MKIIKANIFEKFPEIQFAFSTKIGLKRNPPYFFNMSKSVGDDEKLVEENREKFFLSIRLTSERSIGKEQVAFQKQIHSDIISLVKNPGFQGISDAMITQIENIGLAISTADCPSIFIYDFSKKIIAAVHSGWRGTKEKILSKTLAKLKKEFLVNPLDCVVYIGPSISQKNFEVGKDFENYFDEKYLIPKGDKYLLDLKSANKDMLLDFGIKPENIEVSSLCSYEEDYLHSYRRDGKISGRALGIIVMNFEKK